MYKLGRNEMAKPIKLLKLFLSSTSEIEAERTLIKEIVADVNRVIENSCAVTIRIIDWREDVVPGVAGDAEQVVLSQTKDYDIYVGILGTRFGTPTPRAGSGTEDEFNVAYARFQSDSTSIRLLFYFRTNLTGNILNLDLDELRRVQDFRTKLGTERGVLFCEYSSTEEFIRLFRLHLIQLISTQWGESRWKPMPDLAPVEPQVITSAELAGKEDEPELLDLRVDVDEAFRAAMDALSQVAELMKRGAEEDNLWRLEVERERALSVPTPRKAQELVNTMAKNFEQQARELRTLTAAFKSAADDFFDKIATLADIQIRTDTSTREKLEVGIAAFLNPGLSAAEAVRNIYNQIAKRVASLPTPTREFRRQQRNLTLQIEQFNAALEFWFDRSASLKAQFGGTTDNSPGPEVPTV
jgi:hypothetical protein